MTECLSPWRYAPLLSPDLVDSPNASLDQQRLAPVPAAVTQPAAAGEAKAAR
jgi:hypothetical protein